MTADSRSPANELLSEALLAMQAALDLLDRAKAPAQIGARLDHAISDLQSVIEAAEGARPRSSAGPSVWPKSNPELS